MNIKGIIRQTLYEADESVTGDDRAHQAATADLAVDRVKDRMAGMGARPDLAALRGVTTIEQLSVEPFKYNFLLQVKDKAQELTIPKPIDFHTLARVHSVDNGLVLELKTEDDTNFNVKNDKGEISVKIPGGSIFKIHFDANELVTNLPGTKKGIQAIATGDDGGKGKFYNIGIFDDFIKLLNTGVSESENGEEETPCEKLKVGDKVIYKGKRHIVRKVNTDEIKEGLVQIQLSDDEQVVGNKRPLFAVDCGAVEVGESEGEEKKGGEESNNNYSGDDIDDVNNNFNGLKQKAKYFTKINKYKGNSKFKELFFNSLVGSKSIKVNGEPLLKTLGRMKKGGLLEAETEKESKIFKANLQNFMNSTYLLFAKLNENGKDSQTYKLIKNFYKELYLLSLKTPNSAIYTKVITTFQKFLKFMNELPELSKSESKEKGKKLKTKSQIKATGNTVDNMSEYYINNIANNVKLIFEEEGESTSLEKGKNLFGNSSDLETKIYSKSIILGPKAKAKRGEDVSKFSKGGSGGGTGSLFTKEIKGEVPVSGKIYDIKEGDDDVIKPIIKTFVNSDFKSDRMIIKQSMTLPGSIIIKPQGSGDNDGALVVTPIKPNPNWFKGPIEVKINKNAYAYKGTTPFTGKLMLQPRK